MEISTYIKRYEPVPVDGSIFDVLEKFHINPELSFLPVVNSFGEPLGIVREQSMREFTFTPFGRDLIKRRTISDFISSCPVVSFTTQFEDLVQTPTFQERREGFIVISEGTYAGFLTISSLLKMYEEHRLQSQMQLLQAQKMDSIGKLAGGIAHDFNNILAAINGNTSLFKMKASFLESDPAWKYLTNIETLSSRAAELTRKLLGFAQGGKYEIKRQDMNDTIRRALSLLRPAFNPSFSFKEFLWDDLRPIEGDQAQLEQVLINLLINARDAMPGGGVLSIVTSNLEAASDIVAKQLNHNPNGGISVEVRDTGVGIPPEILPRIFEPFFTTKEPGKGSGMGLAMVYGIVRNHGGAIDVVSKVGNGSTFTLYFPCSAPVAEADLPPLPVVAGTNYSQEKLHASVMVVDDDQFLLPVMSAYLKKIGCTVAAFNDGHEAIRHYGEEHQSIDLVLLDMIMPSISGQEVYRELKQINPSLRAIFVSGYNSNGTMQTLLTNNHTDFLQKPFTFDVLTNRIAEVING